MSDNEDLLGDDLGDHSLADYNLGNDEEDQLLADDYEGNTSQNVPSSMQSFREPEDVVPSDYPVHGIEYAPQPVQYQPAVELESVVPNIVVEVPNLPPVHSTYAPYEPRHYEPDHSVPQAMPAAPSEPPQIVPSEIMATIPNDMARERFVTERPVGAQRLPQVRDIPDSLDKVVISGGGRRGAWRPSHRARAPHPYRRNNMHRFQAHFPRGAFPSPAGPPRPPMLRMQVANDIRPPYQPDRPMEVMELRQPMDLPRPPMDLPRPPMDLPRPPMNLPRQPMSLPRQPMDLPRPPMDLPRPHMDLPRPGLEMARPSFQQFQRFPYREERPMFNQVRPPFERPVYFPRQPFQRFGPPMAAKEPEVLMLPVSLPPGMAPKKVLINPHFKGTFQPPVDGPIKDIDDAAERFIAEQRNALARAANRKRRSPPPQRYIEDTTIEIENELARRPPRRRSDDDLLRRQEEFIHANRAGLRRRMRSPSPAPTGGARRSASPAPLARRDPERERRRPTDEESEYKRRVREQESMRERVLRAKEARRRRNAHAHADMLHDREKEDKDKEQQPKDPKPAEAPIDKAAKVVDKGIDKRPKEEETKPDTTKKTPERDWTPELKEQPANEEVNSTCEEALTPPVARTPPLCSDDELDLILGDIDGILSDDDDAPAQEKPAPKPEPPKPKVTDLRAKLPPRAEGEGRRPRQKITFSEDKEDRSKKEKSPPRKAVVSSTKVDDSEPDSKSAKKQKQDASSNKSRQRIIFETKESAKQTDKPKEKPSFPNRRVVLNQRAPKSKDKSVFSRIEITNDPTKPNAGIFSRAVRTIGPGAAGRARSPDVLYDSSGDEADAAAGGSMALVRNLPHGMTDTRLRTLAGDVQSLSLDKEDRTAKIAFKTTAAAESFRKKFNNKMVAASRLTVTLQ